MRKISISMVLALALLLPQMALAAMTSVTATPSKVTVGPNGGNVIVTWRVVHVMSTNTTVTTSSTSALIKINGGTVATVSTTLSKTSSLTAGVPETIMFSDVLPVSAAIARQISKNPSGATIERSFSDTDGGPLTGTARLSAAGATGDLKIRRIELGFENGGKTRVVAQGSSLRAIAEISYLSSGLLNAEWRLIDPTSIRGSGFERRLRLIRQQLTSSGAGRTRIASPLLPTDRLGLHEIKLHIVDPDPEFDFPVLRYYVNPKSTPDVSRVQSIEVHQPADGASLTLNTVFAWLPIAGVAAYQIEIYDDGGGENQAAGLIVNPLDTDGTLLAGKVVPASVTSTSMAGFSQAHLKHGKSYRWRMRGIGANGNVVGQSEFRKIFYP